MNRPTGLDVFVYLRKSRKDLEEERKARENGENYDVLERHRKRLLELCELEGHTILDGIDAYEEVVTGENLYERPKMQAILTELEKGRGEAIVSIDLERIGRSDMADMGMIYRTFLWTDTLIITPDEIIDPKNESAELLFGVKSIISREELKMINRRLQNGRKDSAKEGKSITNRIPFGYIRGENLRLIPDPSLIVEIEGCKRSIVEQIFRMVANGIGRKQVAAYLDSITPPPTGKEFWEGTTISYIIKNEVYLGRIIWGKYKYRKRFGKYKKQALPREKWITIENAHEPLVSLDLFNKANTAFTERWKPPVIESKGLSNPLAGVLFCELCGRSMLYQPRPNRPNDYIRCIYKGCKGKQKGAILELVEERVIQGLEQIIESFEMENVIYDQQYYQSVIPFKKKALSIKQKEIEDLKHQKNNLHDLLEKGIYDIPTFMERQKILNQRLFEEQTMIDQLHKEIMVEEEREMRKNEYAPKIRTVLEAYRSTSDIENKNQLLRSVLEKATYIRKKEWIRQDEFVIQLYPRI